MPDQEAVSRTLNELKHQKIQPVAKSPRYLLALLVAACAVILLPAAYLALITGLSSLLWVYYDYLGWKFNHIQDLMWLPLYLGPAISLATLVAFLLYPVFTTRITHLTQKVLEPKEQPTLYAFVAQLSRVLGVKPPQLISVTHEANAFAGPADGLWGMLRGKRRLVIGLPLAELLSVKQFGGIIAHELGHFSQRNGQFLVTLMRMVQSWFHRVVADENHNLERFTQRLSQEWRVIGIFIMFARALLVITRFFFVAFGAAADLVTGFLLRQMEYDADRYEARLIGMDVFTETTRELFYIQLAHELAMNELLLYVPEGKLVDNLAAFTAYHRQRISGETLRRFNQLQAETTRSLSDSHPTFQKRIENVRKAGGQAILVSEERATSLFQDFSELCRSFTSAYYRALLKEQFQPNMLHDVETLTLQRKIEHEAGQALARFYRGPLNLSSGSLRFPSRWERDKKGFVPNPLALAKQARRFFEEEQADYRRLLNQYEVLLQQKMQCQRVLLCAPFAQSEPNESKPFSHNHIEILNGQMLKVRRLIARHETRQGLLWWQRGFFFDQIGHSTWVPEALKALPNWRALLRLLNQSLPKVEQLRLVRAEVAALLEQEQADAKRNRARDLLLKQKATTLYTMTRVIVEPLLHQKLSSESGGRETDLGTLPAFHQPRHGGPREIFKAATLFIEQFHDLRCRVIGRLCLLAEHADTDAGLDPLPQPDPADAPTNVLF
ncbi:M48 family metalloprotease [Acanthopleuribacter pedis]|uniref:M48 family metalloprotease n=1 Tax=Acanthopleuribacter pedis TaxID=442870 RepID=A0A8J7QFL9_9BACT|nr:M48 family metalloprotease [Acanthopleuribacter pedis]